MFDFAFQLPGAPARVAGENLEAAFLADEGVEVLFLGRQVHAVQKLHLGQSVGGVDGHDRPGTGPPKCTGFLLSQGASPTCFHSSLTVIVVGRLSTSPQHAEVVVLHEQEHRVNEIGVRKLGRGEQ